MVIECHNTAWHARTSGGSRTARKFSLSSLYFGDSFARVRQSAIAAGLHGAGKDNEVGA